LSCAVISVRKSFIVSPPIPAVLLLEVPLVPLEVPLAVLLLEALLDVELLVDG
jgi:hypothetical protein